MSIAPDPGPANPPQSLEPEDESYFRDRACSPSFAVHCGARSVSQREAQQLLGYPISNASGGIAFLYPKTLPTFVRVRLRGGQYLTRAGAEVPIYLPLGVDHQGERLVVVESPTKAIALAEVGFHAVGLGGVNSCLTPTHALNASWGGVVLVGRPVVLLLDNDRRKPPISRAEARLALALRNAGAKVSLAVLPESADVKGPDDYLAKFGPDGLLEIVDGAVPADPVERVAIAAATGIDDLAALLADHAFLGSLLEADVACLARCRAAFQRARLARDFAGALRDQSVRLSEADRAGQGPTAYMVRGGMLCRADGTALANFRSEIAEEVIIDDGAERTRTFLLETFLADGNRLQDLRLPVAEFLHTRWATLRLGASAYITPGRATIDEVAAAIQSLSNPRKTVIYGASGFRRLEGRPQFLLPGADLGPGVIVEMPDGLQRYRFPSKRHDGASAHRAVLRLLELGPKRVAFPLVLAALRAPINGVVAADFVVHVYGGTGALKSSVVAVVASCFGMFASDTLPASFTDTTSSLEYRLNVAGGVMLPVDELVVNSNSAWDETAGKGTWLMRVVGNGAPKGRMRRDLTARAPRPPRALVVSTGEQRPLGQSIAARTLCLQVNPGDVDVRVLTAAQRERELLASMMRDYVGWIADRYGFVELWAPQRLAELRGELQQRAHLRTVSIAANLLLAAELFVEFSEERGLMTPHDATEFLAGAASALSEATKKQDEVVVDANPVVLFLRLLSELLQTGQVRLDGYPGGSEHALKIGWFRNGEAMLLGETAFGVVARELRARGEHFPTDKETLWRRMRDEKVLLTDKEGKDPKRDVGGRRQRLKVLASAALDEVFPPPAAPVSPYVPPGGHAPWATAGSEN